MTVPNSVLVSLIIAGVLLFASVGLFGLPADIVFGLFIVGFIVTILVSWITQRKRAETVTASQAPADDFSNVTKELEDLRRYHRQILTDLPLGVCAINDDDEITMWNRALEKMTGITNDSFIGKKITMLSEPWLSLLHNFLVGEYAHIYKQSFELDGKKRTVNLHKSIIEESTDNSIRSGGVLILIEDISETEILEAGLTHSERLASIGRLAAGVAHEIGNPITGIACLAQNIRDEYQDDEIRTMARQIIEQTDRTSKIVQSLVSFAHAGNVETNSESEIVTVKDCIDEAITLVSLDKRGKTIHFDVECKPEIQIQGDSQRLMQVLLNLISNARDASQPEGTIRLNVESSQRTVKIEIEDDGVGIAPAIRDRIFDPFFTTKEAGEGTGLGLSLVYSIVEDLHGNIDIISPTKTKPSGGTRVVLSFPGYHMRYDAQQSTDQINSEGIEQDLRKSG